MTDYFGTTAKAGDKIVYPVIRDGRLSLHDAQVARVLRISGKEQMEVLVRVPGKKPRATKYSTPGRFVIIQEVAV